MSIRFNPQASHLRENCLHLSVPTIFRQHCSYCREGLAQLQFLLSASNPQAHSKDSSTNALKGISALNDNRKCKISPPKKRERATTYSSASSAKESCGTANAFFARKTLKRQRDSFQSKSPVCDTTLFQSSAENSPAHGSTTLSTSSPLRNAAMTSTSSGLPNVVFLLILCLSSFCFVPLSNASCISHETRNSLSMISIRKRVELVSTYNGV